MREREMCTLWVLSLTLLIHWSLAQSELQRVGYTNSTEYVIFSSVATCKKFSCFGCLNPSGLSFVKENKMGRRICLF